MAGIKNNAFCVVLFRNIRVCEELQQVLQDAATTIPAKHS